MARHRPAFWFVLWIADDGAVSPAECRILRAVPTESMSAAFVALARAEWQATVFAARPHRVALLKLHPSWPLQQVRVAVLRNHAVEPMLTVLRPFLAYAGFAADVSLSGYDDSLSAPPRVDSDVHVVWLDASRYPGSKRGFVAETLGRRLSELRRDLDGPILLVDSQQELDSAGINAVLRDAAERMPDVYVFPYARITEPLCGGAIEARTGSMGTHVSGDAALLSAQHLGLQWLPAMVRPRLKAVVVDLDDTIVGGVLGEDGTLRVVTDGPYARVRERLLSLHKQGVLLALVTKNDPRDVERLFAERRELSGLRGAFAAVEASWRSKAESVRAVVTRLHVGTDSVLVVDDNAGEVAAMAAALCDPWFLIASDPDLCAQALTLHPGLLALRADELGSLRAADIVAGERRAAETARAAEPGEYLLSLGMSSRLSMNAPPDVRRLSELSRKTNQFNTSLRRFTETDVERYITAADRRVVSIRLRDRLSDSGLIGAVFARREGDTVVIDEIAISCRALGRSVERVLLDAALSRIAAELACTRVVLQHTSGPRNAPAQAWLSEAAVAIDAGRYEYPVVREDSSVSALRPPIDLTWEEDGARHGPS